MFYYRNKYKIFNLIFLSAGVLIFTGCSKDAGLEKVDEVINTQEYSEVEDITKDTGTEENDNLTFDSVLHEEEFDFSKDKKATVKLHGNELEYRFGISSIEVITEDGKTMIIDMYDSENDLDYVEAFASDANIHLEDIDFDGYTEIGINCGVTAYNCPMDYWHYSEELEGYYLYKHFLDRVSVDSKNQTCTESYRDAFTYYDDIYKVFKASEYDLTKLYISERKIKKYTSADKYTEYTEDTCIGVDNPAYIKLLNNLMTMKQLPGINGETYIESGDPLNNYYGIGDVDEDGEDELLINYSNTENMSDMLFAIYGYDKNKDKVYAKLVEFPAVRFYKNGFVEAEASHNHGRSNNDEFWPYNLYQYSADTGFYEHLYMVDAWEKEFYNTEEEPFPTKYDTDGNGIIYYLSDRDGQIVEYFDDDAFFSWKQQRGSKIDNDIFWNKIH